MTEPQQRAETPAKAKGDITRMHMKPNCGGKEIISGQQWYHSKEQ